MPARAGFRGTLMRIVCLPLRNAVSLQIKRHAEVFPGAGREDANLDEVVHRRLGLMADAVGPHLPRDDVERHLVLAAGRPLGDRPLGLHVPERDRLEQVGEQVLQRVRRDGAQLTDQIERGRVRRRAIAVLLEQASQRRVDGFLANVLAQRVHRDGALAVGDVRVVLDLRPGARRSRRPRAC